LGDLSGLENASAIDAIKEALTARS
jgi:hypothetical protein